MPSFGGFAVLPFLAQRSNLSVNRINGSKSGIGNREYFVLDS